MSANWSTGGSGISPWNYSNTVARGQRGTDYNFEMNGYEVNISVALEGKMNIQIGGASFTPAEVSYIDNGMEETFHGRTVGTINKVLKKLEAGNGTLAPSAAAGPVQYTFTLT